MSVEGLTSEVGRMSVEVGGMSVEALSYVVGGMYVEGLVEVHGKVVEGEVDGLEGEARGMVGMSGLVMERGMGKEGVIGVVGDIEEEDISLLPLSIPQSLLFTAPSALPLSEAFLFLHPEQLFTCRFTLSLREKLLPHLSHKKVNPSWTLATCLFRFLAWAKDESHWSHFNLAWTSILSAWLSNYNSRLSRIRTQNEGVRIRIRGRDISKEQKRRIVTERVYSSRIVKSEREEM
jgi:hypothetical protein